MKVQVTFYWTGYFCRTRHLKKVRSVGIGHLSKSHLKQIGLLTVVASFLACLA